MRMNLLMFNLQMKEESVSCHLLSFLRKDEHIKNLDKVNFNCDRSQFIF